jgi:hypothetical protein
MLSETLRGFDNPQAEWTANKTGPLDCKIVNEVQISACSRLPGDLVSRLTTAFVKSSTMRRSARLRGGVLVTLI